MNKGIRFASVSLLVVLLVFVAAVACLADAAGDLARGKELYEACNHDAAILILNTVVSADAALAPEALKYISSCYYAEKKYPEAIAAAKKRVEMVTSAGERQTVKDARGQLATAYRDGGKIDEAMDLYRALLVDYPELAFAYYYGLGMCHKARRNYEQAAAEFSKSEKSAAHQSMANTALLEVCDCLFRQGRHSEVEAKLKQRMESAAASGERETERDMKGRLAVLYRDKGDYAAAIALYEELLAGWPDNASGYQYGLGICYKGRGDGEKAAEYFKQSAANAKSPSGGWQPLVEAAACLARQGKAKEAEELIRKAYADYAWAKVEIMLLRAYLMVDYVKDYEKAIAIFEEVIEGFPNNQTEVENAVVGLAESMRYLGKTDEAIAYAKKLYDEQPKLRAAALFAEGRVCMLPSDYDDFGNDYERSIVTLSRLLSEFPDHRLANSKEARQLLVTALQIMGRVDEAVEAIKSALPKDATPEQKAANMDQIGTLCYRAKKYREAALAFEEELRVVGISPELEASGLYYLGLCSYHLGDIVSAKRNLTSVVDRFPTSQSAQDAKTVLYVWSRL